MLGKHFWTVAVSITLLMLLGTWAGIHFKWAWLEAILAGVGFAAWAECFIRMNREPNPTLWWKILTLDTLTVVTLTLAARITLTFI